MPEHPEQRRSPRHAGAHKFDPARAHLLDSPERARFLPEAPIIALLQLSGDETVLDYGAGTGRFAIKLVEELPQGRVIAIDESAEMVELLEARTAGRANIETVAITDNDVPLPDACADRILAVNLLHEVRGERALVEMRRLLAEQGLLIVVDWDRDRASEPGPPSEHRYSAAEAQQELISAGFETELLSTTLPYHFTLRAQRSG